MTEASIQKLEKKVIGFHDQARLIVVYDNKTLVSANDFLILIKLMRKEVIDTFGDMKKKARDTLNEIIAKIKKYDEPLAADEKAVKLQVGGYMMEQERIRREVEEKARLEEEKRVRIEKEKEKEAKELEKLGYEESAEKVRSEIPEPTTIVPEGPPKLEGTSVKTITKWRVVNIKLVPRKHLMINSASVTQHVQATKGKVPVPGIEIYTEASVATSRG